MSKPLINIDHGQQPCQPWFGNGGTMNVKRHKIDCGQPWSKLVVNRACQCMSY